jgi:cytochrome c oxidase subunit 4
MILFCLTFITVYSAQFHFGKWNTFIALTIATTKATLVLLYFMHLKHESLLLKGTFLVTILVLAIFIGLTFTDTAYRIVLE